MDLTKTAAYSNKTPYDLWQESEGIPIVRGHCVEDLTAIPVAPWKRAGALGSFINLIGSGRACGAYVLEIPPRSETQPQRYLFEQLIYVIKGRGATSVWNQGGAKQTFEWQEGSLFSPPLNAWHQHFNAQGTETARFVALTDAPQMINRFRNIDFIFSNGFAFRDRFNGEDGYYNGKGREVASHRTWEANFIADVRDFGLKDRSLRGQ
ncbi:MAG TPA: ethanolamine ammonia lyase-activating protein, partial [Candidatus Binatia bacterium]|nr:ethanolamine ammonia lyase-activating protein [Candidatus Binatia bacterium]